MHSPIKTFDQAVEAIAALEKRGWRLGLDRMQEFARRADLLPSLSGSAAPRYVHIAGTNGKGSVTAYVQSIMRHQGHRTGAFFSPYVYDVRERIQGPDGLISRDDFAYTAARLMPIADEMNETELGGPTEFEFKTAMALTYWQRLGCEAVALEVGLGGRLDATNIVTPAVSVITSIGWDHMHILGDTLGAIAAEKAGIIKPGIPVVLGPMSLEPRDVILQRAAELQAPVYEFARQFDLDQASDGYFLQSQFGNIGPLQPGMAGAMQPENMSLAVIACLLAGLVVRGPELLAGVAAAHAPGRFQQVQYRGRTVILDGAHNQDSAENLERSLAAQHIEKVVLITNMLQGHDPYDFYHPLLPRAVSAHVAPIDYARARPVEEISQLLESWHCSAQPHVGVLSALDAAIADAREHPGAVILVTGSFYLVGEVGRAIMETDPSIDLQS